MRDETVQAQKEDRIENWSSRATVSGQVLLSIVVVSVILRFVRTHPEFPSSACHSFKLYTVANGGFSVRVANSG